VARDRSDRPDAAPLRLFVAIALPAEVGAALDAAIEPLRVTFPRARWVPPQNRHVTLKFLGGTFPRFVEDTLAGVEAAAAAQRTFETGLTALGAFPLPARARVLWAGLDDRPGPMAELALAVDHALASMFPPESRAFTPHITLARSDPPLRLADPVGTLPPIRFAVTEVTVFRSRIRRPAPVYEPVGRYPLGVDDR
jgi:RNA 2',3'-cyclic 3'-phosphodiesterase